MSTQLMLPDERAAQLRRFADALQISMAEAVGVMLNEQIAAGRIPDELPGIKVEKFGEQVKVDFGTFARQFNRDAAKRFAEQLQEATAPLRNVALQKSLGIIRRGAGVKLKGEAGEEKVVTPSVAADLARIIQKAAR